MTVIFFQKIFIMEILDQGSHPLSGLDWSSTWHKISLESNTKTQPPTMTDLSMLCVVENPALVEEISPFLPNNLRAEMLGMALSHKKSGSIIPLLYTWHEPVLSLKKIFPNLFNNPELVGDLRNQVCMQFR